MTVINLHNIFKSTNWSMNVILNVPIIINYTYIYIYFYIYININFLIKNGGDILNDKYFKISLQYAVAIFRNSYE